MFRALRLGSLDSTGCLPCLGASFARRGGASSDLAFEVFLDAEALFGDALSALNTLVNMS